MTTESHITWQTANYRYLISAVMELQTDFLSTAPSSAIDSVTFSSIKKLSQMHLEQLCQIFKLSTFERQILLLCVGFELIPEFAQWCKAAGNKNTTHPLEYPSFAMALALFAGADETPLNPYSPLRYWQLLEIDNRHPLLTQPLRINECVLHYLAGYPIQDKRLAVLLTPLSHEGQSCAFYSKQIEHIIAIWRQQLSPMPLLYLSGSDLTSQRQIAQQVCAELHFPLFRIETHQLPENQQEWSTLLHLLTRDTWLHYNRVYLIECDTIPAEKQYAATLLAQALPANCMLLGSAPLAKINYPLITIPIPAPTPAEQRQLWQQALAAPYNPGAEVLAQISAQFDFSASQIQQLTHELKTDPSIISLWQLCRQKLRIPLENLAQIIEPQASWQDLNLTAATLNLLKTIVMQVKQRSIVYQDWGFAAKNRRGLGVCALFHGPSGTGKTLAAEVIASELQLDIYHIDLSAIISKYIGETEKHLKQIFDHAENNGAILLFDEADALFGKRSAIKDSHDRHANSQVNYLLQRIESYRGLSILTTNLKNVMDEAFLRRFRFIVPFTFPDQQQRAQIWQHVFPIQTPTQQLDWDKLARLNLAGGHIRNIALNAAFLAADQQQPVTMAHVLAATQAECLKLERVLTEAEVQDWI